MPPLVWAGMGIAGLGFSWQPQTDRQAPGPSYWTGSIRKRGSRISRHTDFLRDTHKSMQSGNHLTVGLGFLTADNTDMVEHHKEGPRKRKANLAGHPEWMEYPRTRPKALKAGVDFFFSGRMCKNRHYNLRTVLGSRCVACESQAQDVSPTLATFIQD